MITRTKLILGPKEVQIVYRLFLVNCYLLHICRLPSQPACSGRGWVIGFIWLWLSWQYIAMARNNLSIILISLLESCRKFSKDCSSKFRSKHSSNTVLCLLRNLLEQSLNQGCLQKMNGTLDFDCLRSVNLRSIFFETPLPKKRKKYLTKFLFLFYILILYILYCRILFVSHTFLFRPLVTLSFLTSTR